MANSTTHASLPYPIRKARYTLEYVGLDSTGTPTDPTTPDTELSLDGGSFADATEEISTITGSNGCGYITLTGAEMDTALTLACVKVASGPKPTVFSLRPRNLAIIGSGTLSAGSAGGGTLGTLLAYDVTGCFIRTTGGTGGGGTGGANNQVRRIITYNTSTGACTVSPNWETTPSTDTTYDVLLPEGVTLGMLKTLNPATPGNTINVSGGRALSDVDTIKTQAVTCAAGVTVLASVGTAATSTAQTGDTYAALSGAQAEPGQGAPAVNASILTKIAYLYKAWRNKKTQTATTLSLFADDASTVDQKATVSDDATTLTTGEIASGP